MRRLSLVRPLLTGFAIAAAALPAFAQANLMQVEHDVTVQTMVSDRFTWRDSGNQPRAAVLAHNDNGAGPGGSQGGELRELDYQTSFGTRVVRASSSAAAGFGYVVSHPDDGSETCMAGPDSSALGHFVAGTFTRVFEGRHHAIFRFTQSYPRYCQTGPTAPAAPINVPVTIDWVFATGRDHPLWAITWDLSGVAADTLSDDSRAPYGELLFDGSAGEGSHRTIAGVGWGDRYKFVSTTNPVTYNSDWTWNTPNTVPYVKLWTTPTVDATMGTVQTQTILQQDAGGYFETNRWNTTSADGNGCILNVNFGDATHKMLCDFNWPYQSINYSLNNGAPNTTTNNTRLAWGTSFGFLGQSAYHIHGSTYWGGPLPDVTQPGWPKKSYSTFVVFGLHSTDPVGAQVTQIENVQNTALTASIGSVATSGPAGVNRVDTLTYQPAGWNHVYAAWALQAADNAIDANFNVASGTLANPLVIVSNWTAGLPTTALLNGVALAQDVDYFPSLGPTQQLWLTLNASLSGATNHLELSSNATATPTPTPTPTPSGPIALTRTSLRFGAVRSGTTLVSTTPAQTSFLTAPGAWTASSNQPWLAVAPTSGSGNDALTVSMAGVTTGLPTTGPTQGTITVTAPGASNSPQTITVNVQVYAPGQTIGPFGSFDTPTNNTTGVTGAIPVTGWALDDIGIASIKLYRDPVTADGGNVAPNGKVYIADALFVSDARPDVDALYQATTPFSYRAAWGNMVLTNFLPSGPNPVGGNGTFTLYAYMQDYDGHQSLLGTKTITVDNASATKPFGTIDTPAQGGTVSGLLDNFGWALTPGTATIPTDGSTVQVFVDGNFLGTAQYNLPRNDIQTLFPGYTNTDGAIGYFQIDTTALANGAHTIFWIVTDDQNRADGIGSRFFTVLN